MGMYTSAVRMFGYVNEGEAPEHIIKALGAEDHEDDLLYNEPLIGNFCGVNVKYMQGYDEATCGSWWAIMVDASYLEISNSWQGYENPLGMLSSLNPETPTGWVGAAEAAASELGITYQELPEWKLLITSN